MGVRDGDTCTVSFPWQVVLPNDIASCRSAAFRQNTFRDKPLQPLLGLTLCDSSSLATSTAFLGSINKRVTSDRII